MNSRNWPLSLASLFGWLVGLFLLGSCGEPGLLIDTGTWPESVVALRVRSKLDSVSGAVQHLDPNQSRFVLYVPERRTSYSAARHNNVSATKLTSRSTSPIFD